MSTRYHYTYRDVFRDTEENEMSRFLWTVPTKGYRWVLDDHGGADAVDGHQAGARGHQPTSLDDEGQDSDEDCEAMSRLEPVLNEFQDYEPFKQPGLFRTFAILDPTKDAILGFANRYGHLGDDAEFPDDHPAPRDLDPELDADELRFVPEEERSLPIRDWCRRERFYYSLPEPMSRWTRAIESMRRCVEKWDQFRDGALDRSGVDNLLEEINEQLVFQVELMLRPRERSPNLFTIEYVPRHLLAALWIQMAQAVAENKSLRECPGCGRWFEWSSKGYLRSRHYCKDACKSQAYRNRKIKAVQMAEAGRNPKEIAKCLDTRVAIVKGWLKRH
jgi:hypothetical protein